MPIEFHHDGPWEIPRGWVWARANDFAQVVGGGTPSNAEDQTNFEENGIPWITPADLSKYASAHISHGARSLSKKGFDNSSARLMPPGTLLISSRAPVGYTVVATNEVCTNQGFKSLVFKTEMCPEFFRYYVIFNRKYFVDNASGTTFKELSGNAMGGLLFPVAPIVEQRRIVARIDELFTDIADGETALNRARNDLDTWRRALLKAAVTGELTREWREQTGSSETGAELLGRISEIRSRLGRRTVTRRSARSADEIELPHFDLPETWCSATWSEIGTSQNGKPFPSNDYSECGVKLLRPGNLYANGHVAWTKTNTRYLPEHYLVDNPDLLVRGGELVINLTAQSLKDEFLGRACMTDPDEHCLLNQRLARLTPIEVLPAFALLVFKSSFFRSFVRKSNSGSLIQHMFTSQIEGFMFPLPPLEEQAAIVASVNHAVGAVEEMEKLGARGTETPVHLRRSILKTAFEGRLVEQDPRDEPAEALLTRIGEDARQSPPASSRVARRARGPAAGAKA